MATENRRHLRRSRPAETVERNRRDTRWLHAGIFTCTLVLLFTGGWLLFGQEGKPSILAIVAHASDVVLHKIVGWILAGLGVLAVVVWRHRVAHFLRETFRWDRGDLRWLLRWPAAVRSGRFDRHEGDFDPAQRGANVILVGGLILLIGCGVGLVLVHGGPVFVWLHRVHTWVTYAVTVMIVGHVVVASGVLPGYHGTWRAMHLGGRLPVAVARRLWPAWLERQQRLQRRDPPPTVPPTGFRDGH
ncbi:cytochrome b/b6 domain-containing protein [Microlunatus soli]|uniref:Formate dehydrogenase subunit gamma n=1 Tax=Microlunatus soli TaxID=630515 RepID=A0A1H2A404_9ACTN|nr:cytochrome b/b6 domain-containing protein [Microlunatus soli]SDT40718.1 formate dehydrogenase subunit gamma [Microlunatus soli]